MSLGQAAALLGAFNLFVQHVERNSVSARAIDAGIIAKSWNAREMQ